MATAETAADPAFEMPSIRQWTTGRIREWSDACSRFLTWEREYLLLREPTVQDVAEHKQALRWLLQITRLFHGEEP